jgi:hypothetical protein
MLISNLPGSSPIDRSQDRLMSSPLRARPANPLWQRLLRRWRQWRGAALVKDHQVHLIDVDGQRYKRIRFASLAEAEAAAQALRAVHQLDRFPGLIRHDGKEIWTEFIPGPLANRRSADHAGLIADFFVDLYRLPGTHQSPDLKVFKNDLGFLVQTGWLEAAQGDELVARAATLQPKQLLIGHDYLDPVAKNFVIREDRAMAIDVEALLAAQPLGTGLAKAVLRWPGLDSTPVLEALIATGGPDLRDQYPFVELCFLAAYFRQKIIQKKPRHLRMDVLLKQIP